MSESGDQMYIDAEMGTEVHTKDGDLYYQPFNYISDKVNKVWVTTVLPRRRQILNWDVELFDINYVYHLETTLQVKNFRDNVRRFEERVPHETIWSKGFHSGIESGNYIGDDLADSTFAGDTALSIVKEWYRMNKEDVTDFGYTLWLSQHFWWFPDMRCIILKVNSKAVGCSIWGVLDRDTAIHLICKTTTGDLYSNDFLRYETYKQMKQLGYVYCNDGSDCGSDGIAAYKRKLRPKFIIPIYSWIRKQT
jgi:hypothetical protein